MEQKIKNRIYIDFETANTSRASLCAVAAVKYDLITSEEIGRYYSLVNPQEYFDTFNIMIHGITPDMVSNAPIFPSAMAQVFSMADEYTMFIAHNTAFDISVMRYAAYKYGMDFPDIQYTCTYRLAKQLIPEQVSYTLPIVAELCSITGLNHHNAESDAEVCGRIFLHFYEKYQSIEKLMLAANLKIGYIVNGEFEGIHKIKRDHKTFEEKIRHELPTYAKGEESLFYNKTVCFTGAMQSMTRAEAEYVITDIGGIAASGVTKNVDYLVTGYQDIKKLNGKEKSSKVISAEKLLAKGHKIEVIPEDEFLKML